MHLIPARSGLSVSLAGLLALACASCSEPPEPKINVSPVAGKVSFNGEAPVGAQVLLHPQGHALPDGLAALATVKADGTFRPSIYGDGSGVPPGDYVVTLQWFKLVGGDGGAGPGPNVLPKAYGKPETSPIKVTVKDGDRNEIEAIEIRK